LYIRPAPGIKDNANAEPGFLSFFTYIMLFSEVCPKAEPADKAVINKTATSELNFILI